MANSSSHHTLIIGAGAAGLMAAIHAGRSAPKDSRIAVLDGAKKIGAKILVSGGGRCNVTHHMVAVNDYAGSNRNQIAKVLRIFPVEDTIEFFKDLGVILKREDTGKLFPTTDRAQTVLGALLSAVSRAGVDILPDHRVTSIVRDDDRFSVNTHQGELHAKNIILATGGKSLPKTGSDGLGYELARGLGHTITKTTPALVPLILEKGHWLTTLTGLAFEVELCVSSGTGKVLHRQRGAMLATHFGLSGPAAMDISRHWIAARAADPGAGLAVNFMPGRSFEEVDALLLKEAQLQGSATAAYVLYGHFPQRFARALIEQATGVDSGTAMSRLSKPDRRSLVHALTKLPLPVLRDRGYLFAEVTAGGVPLSELNLSTLASRTCPGLYLCGEILDVDGRIGGYNFQWAWCSGRLAGTSAVIG